MNKYIFTNNKIEYVIVSLDYNEELSTHCRFIDMDMPLILKKRLDQDESNIELIMTLYQDSYIFAKTFNTKIIIICNKQDTNYYKIICNKLSTHIVKSYTNLDNLYYYAIDADIL